MKDMDPEVAEYLKGVRARPPAHLIPIKELRRDIDKLRKIYPPEHVKKIEDINIPGPAGEIPLRIYTPEGKGPFPLMLFCHGGGWCIGSLDGYEGICAKLTNKVPAVVVSVGYRLAPEHAFPAAVDDCWAALKYAGKNACAFNALPETLAVMGDSAGGNLAAAVSLRSKEENGPKIAMQILVYPATNMSILTNDSYRLFGKGYDLDSEMIEMFRSHYLPHRKDWTDPYVSPSLAKDLRGLPPALVITAEFDPLRDDGNAFADRLKEAGVCVRHSLYKGVIHGFLSFTTFLTAQKAFDEIASTFRQTINMTTKT